MRVITPKFCRFCGSPCAWREIKNGKEWACKDCGAVYKTVRRNCVKSVSLRERLGAIGQ